MRRVRRRLPPALLQLLFALGALGAMVLCMLVAAQLLALYLSLYLAHAPR